MADPLSNKEVRLASRPGANGEPCVENFVIAECPYPKLLSGQVVIKTLYLSVDPALRCQMNEVTGVNYLSPWKLNKCIEGLAGLGKVVESSCNKFKVGELVTRGFAWPWSLYFATTPDHLQKVDFAAVNGKLSLYISCLGLIGLTSLLGIREKAHIVNGSNQTVVISGAAGACGSIAGQIAKLDGCGKLVGICGSDEKCKVLKEELKFDAVINYKTEDVKKRLMEECGNGIHVYFDNVGGSISDIILENMSDGGNVVLCGQISQYNKDVEYPPKLKPEIMDIIEKKGINRDRFLVLSYQNKFGECLLQLGKWLATGQLKVKETMMEGLEETPNAFVGMMNGENIGKMLVHIADP